MCMFGINYMNGMLLSEWLVKQGVERGLTDTILLAVLGGAIVVSPLAGYVVDNIGVARANLGHAILAASLTVPQYYLASKFPYSPVVVACAGAGVAALLQGLSGTVLLWVANLFPSEHRGMAVCTYYNIGALAGTLARALGTLSIPTDGSNGWRKMIPGYYILGSCCLTASMMALSLYLNHQDDPEDVDKHRHYITSKHSKSLKVAHILADPY